LGGYTQVANDTLPGSEILRNQTLLEPSAEYSNSADAMV